MGANLATIVCLNIAMPDNCANAIQRSRVHLKKALADSSPFWAARTSLLPHFSWIWEIACPRAYARSVLLAPLSMPQMPAQNHIRGETIGRKAQIRKNLDRFCLCADKATRKDTYRPISSFFFHTNRGKGTVSHNATKETHATKQKQSNMQS